MFARSVWSNVVVGCLIVVFVLAGGSKSAAAQNCLGIVPSNLQMNFGLHAVGTTTLTKDVTVTNNCAATMQVNSFSMSPSQFKLLGGWAPITLAQGKNMIFELRFSPDAAQAYSGTFTLNVQGYSPVLVSMTGTGFLPGAIPSWSTSSLTFSNVPLGTTSAPQNITLTNTGTKSVIIQNVYTDPPFTVTGFTANQTLGPKASLTMPVTYAPWLVGPSNGLVTVITNNLLPTGVTLYGTGVAPSSLAVTNFPVLPISTQGAAYLAQLLSMSGVGAVTWKLASGSTLPTGLSLSNTGSITGTVASTVALGNYLFSVTATDSSSHTATAQFTLSVSAPTGAICNNIEWDVTGTTTPMVALPDLGTGTYLGAQGGLYLNGSNVMPASHDADGVSFAQSIQPLDANGNPDPNGKYAILSIGMSVTFDTFLQFIQDVAADPSVNKSLVLAQGAQPRLGAADWTDVTGPAWVDTLNYFLPQAGVTPQQVVAAWVESVDANPHGTFPSDMVTLQAEYESTAQVLHTLFPNLKLAFYSGREYAAYENGLQHPGDKEPYAYESNFAVRGMIQDQLNGVAAMNYNPANGPVMAPWVAWGPYLWTDGLLARSDGQFWPCHDFKSDGQHPSTAAGGTERNANMLLNFMKTDDATSPWFLAH
jgi:hypothetical protein